MDSRKILSPLSDLVFKALFGREKKESKLILINFLNATLHLQGQAKIQEITYLNPFNIQNFEGDKTSILDLKVKTEEGKRINIEVQVNKEDDFRKRSLYYWAKCIQKPFQNPKPIYPLKVHRLEYIRL